MGSKQQKYDADFREGAVHILIETRKAIPEVAEELGVHPGTLHSWSRGGAATARLPLTGPRQPRRVAGCGRPNAPSWSGCGGR
ncbi:transposase [Streptomyces sp. NPDC090442]|uniref:transposase n=1 Tax=Streptomyces sp. NPDC090442 TaxID=3365962 RepID=UPI0037F2D6D9